MQTRVAFCWFMMLLLAILCYPAIPSQATQAATPDRLFRDVPRSDHAYKTLEKLGRARIAYLPSICFPSSHGAKYDMAHRCLTRYEFAVVVQRALATLELNQRKHNLTASQRGLLNEVHQLAYEFHAELALLQAPSLPATKQ